MQSSVPTTPTTPPRASAGLSFFIGILAFCLVGLLIVAIRGGLTAGQTYDEKRAELRATRLATLRKSEHHILTSYAWVDKAKGVVQLPIERAMQLTESEIQHGGSASSIKADANTTNIVPPYIQSAPPAAAASPSPAPAK